MDKKKVSVISPDGTLGDVDSSELEKAINFGGYKIATPEDISAFDNKKKYGEGLGTEARAFGEAAARGASFGLSDVAFRAMGVEPEALKGRQEYNPLASGLGEATGIGASLLLGPAGAVAEGVGAGAAKEGASLLSKVLNPVSTVSKIGQDITKASEPIMKKAASLLANPETSPIVNKVLSQAGAHAAGSAVEGAFYGAGKSISEAALGDPDLNAEKVASNIGIMSLFGGAIGGFAGGVGGLAESVMAKRAIPKFVSEADQPKLNAGDFRASVSASEFSTEEKNKILSELTKLKDNAKEISAAADDLGAPVLEGQLSASKYVRQAEDALLNGPPTPWSMGRQELATKGYQKAEQVMSEQLGSGVALTEAELGSALKASHAEKIGEEAGVFNELYDEIKQHFEVIPLSNRSLNQVALNIEKLDDVTLSPSSPAARIANRVSEEIKNLKTVDDVKRYKTLLRGSISGTSSPQEKYIVGVLSEKLANLENSSIIRFAENEMKTTTAKERILGLLEKRKIANTKYADFAERMQELGKGLGKKRFRGAQDMIDFIDDMNPQQLARKVFNESNVEFAQNYAKSFPEEFQLIRQHELANIKGKATKDGYFSSRRAIKEINSYQPETRKLLFDADQLKKVKSVETYINSFPEKFNPSGTAHTEALREFFGGPVKAAWGTARDKALDSFIKGAVKYDKETGANIAMLADIERGSSKVTSKIQSKVSSVFKLTHDIAVPVGAITGSVLTRDEKRKEFDKNSEKIKDHFHDVDKMNQALQNATQGVYNAAPKTAEALQSAMVRATAFLNSKLPQGGAEAPLSNQYVPSDSEISKFNRYFSVVKDPTLALDQVKHATITPETIETLQTVYPSLYNDMKTNLLSKLMEHKNKAALPYKTKLSISMFLGQDMTRSLSQTALAANQLALAFNAQMNGQRGLAQMKPSKTGMSNIDQSNRLLTPMQSSNRREKL